MHCPFCRHNDTKVLDSRVAEDGTSIRRRRCCQRCEQRFTTLELMQLTVVKRSGATEAFDRDKAIAGVRKACNGRPVTEDDLARLGQVVEDALRGSGQAEFASHEIGMAILGAAARARRGRLPPLRRASTSSSSPPRTSRSRSRACASTARSSSLQLLGPATTSPQPPAADHRPPGTSWGSGVPGAPPGNLAVPVQCRCQQEQ